MEEEDNEDLGESMIRNFSCNMYKSCKGFGRKSGVGKGLRWCREYRKFRLINLVKTNMSYRGERRRVTLSEININI